MALLLALKKKKKKKSMPVGFLPHSRYFYISFYFHFSLLKGVWFYLHFSSFSTHLTHGGRAHGLLQKEHIWVHMSMHARAHICTCMCVPMYLSPRTRVCDTCIYMNKRVYVHMRAYTCVHMHVFSDCELGIVPGSRQYWRWYVLWAVWFPFLEALLCLVNLEPEAPEA